MHKQLLHDGWTVRPVSNLENVPANCRDVTPATVPGCIHTDLLNSNKILDPYYDRVEPTLRWIGQTDWRYETTFTADESLFDHERVDLAADGLDTVATIELNGQLVAKTENMHVGNRWDVKKFLKPGQNTLAITFTSAEHYAFEMEKRIGKLPFNNTRVPFNMIRKMACNFSWDWGPEFITCGIWRGIRLEGWSLARTKKLLASRVSFDGDKALLVVEVELETTSENWNYGSETELRDPDGKQIFAKESRAGKNKDTTTFEIPNAQVWWPHGYGEQPLYTLRQVISGDEKSSQAGILDDVQFRIGLRTVELDTTPDAVGSAFTLKVNGKPIFCRGYNWIPDDCFLDRACTPQRYRKRIQQALGSNANMLRVWGGGIFETDEFYDICDELGVLVWQDCLFACAAYPEEAPFPQLVEQEIRYNAARLAHHPSLVLWNGCNENVWGYRDWGWQGSTELKGRTWGAGYYFEQLPKLFEQVDPPRPYWAASPWSGDPNFETGLHPNLASHGNKHVWEVWCRQPAAAYREYVPRFCSEFGFQAPPTYATLAESMPPEQLQKGSPGMLARQKHPQGEAYNAARLAEAFDEPKSFDDWHYVLQLNQARSLQLGVEWFRSRMPECMGALYWQLNDCWPVNSWSAIDSDGRPKPLWFATRRFFAPRLLTIQPKGKLLELCAVNDSDEPWRLDAAVTVHNVDGTKREVQKLNFDASPRSVERIVLEDTAIGKIDPAKDYLVVQAGNDRATWFFAADKDFSYPTPAFESSIDRAAGVTMLTIKANTLLRDVLIQVDRLDPTATIAENLVTLLPGAEFVFEIRSAKDLSKESLTSPPVFNCANNFGNGR